MRVPSIIGRWSCLLGVLALVACAEQELYSGLSEQDANEMVAVLYESDYPGTKSRTPDGLFAVSTSRESFARAVGLLKTAGFPRVRYDSLGEVFAKEGFVSSPLEERARLNHAMSQEIAHTLSRIDGVLVARVHLAVPEPDELTDTVMPASASVFIKHRADVDLSGNVGQIKALVVNGIENLPYEQVTVALFGAEAERRVPSRRDEGRSDVNAVANTRFNGMPPLGSLSTVAAAGAGVLLLASGAVYGLRRRSRSGKLAQPEIKPSTGSSNDSADSSANPAD